ncbi:MAG: hypothetical protein ACFFCW_09000, partial [Candidatus Hodarchaeota archaeon]
RTSIPKCLSDKSKDEMIRFFGAYEAVFHKPMVNKYNNMNLYAHLIADALKTSFFICVTRDPVYLAQSLLRARIDIHGNVSTPYGIHRHKEKESNSKNRDFVQDVCEQVLYHEEETRKQQQIIGSERFWIISYEDFCKRPEELVKRVSDQILRQPIDIKKLREKLKPFDTANTMKLEPQIFRKIQRILQ